MNYTNLELKKKKNRNLVVVIFIVLLLVMILLLSLSSIKANKFAGKLEKAQNENTQTKKKIEKKQSEIKDLKAKYELELNVRAELNDLIDEHENLSEENTKLNDELKDKDLEITSLMKEVQQLLLEKNKSLRDLETARIKIDTLQQISQRYFKRLYSLQQEVDELETANKEKDKLNESLSEQLDVRDLVIQKYKDTIKAGAILKASNINIEKIKFGYNAREKSTRRAKNVQILRACFDISSNALSRSEEKTVYIQYIDPNGRLLRSPTSPENASFSFTKGEVVEKVDCTTYKKFNYQKKALSLCVDWQRKDILSKGKYSMKIYLEKRLVGTEYFILH